jgi:phosphohistidine phosphatase
MGQTTGTTVPAWFYRQAAVIPYRRRGGKLEILLITTHLGKHWGVPKGVVDPGETPVAAAVREALEEAGIRGRLHKDFRDRYSYKKWGGTCTVEVFALEVTDELADWDERAQRQRRWLAAENAAGMVKQAALGRIIAGFAAAIAEPGHPQPAG